MIQQLIPACWIAFLAYWLISARATKKTAERQSFVAGMIYRVPQILGALLIFKPIPFSPWNLLVVPNTPMVQAIAVGLCVVGLLGAIWSRRTLATNWSSEVVFKEQHELVERGPYHFVRHPIYTSILLMVLGSALAAGRLSSLAGFLLIVVGLYLKLKQEEVLLLRHFPDQYAVYKTRVKALVPFVL